VCRAVPSAGRVIVTSFVGLFVISSFTMHETNLSRVLMDPRLTSSTVALTSSSAQVLPLLSEDQRPSWLVTQCKSPRAASLRTKGGRT